MTAIAATVIVTLLLAVGLARLASLVAAGANATWTFVAGR
jgi:hypothetical protein